MARFPIIVVKAESDDTSTLLSKTSSEVSDILKNQLETFRRLEEISNCFSKLSINVSKESEQASQILHVVTLLSDASVELHKVSDSIQRVEQKLEGECHSPQYSRVRLMSGSCLQIRIESKRTRLLFRSVKSGSGCQPSNIRISMTMHVNGDFWTLDIGCWKERVSELS